MDIPLLPGGKRIVAALVFAAAAVWALIHYSAAPLKNSEASVPIMPAAAPRKPRTPIHRKLAVTPADPAKPAEPAEARGSRLRAKGEALGGKTPDRVDTGTMTVPASR